MCYRRHTLTQGDYDGRATALASACPGLARYPRRICWIGERRNTTPVHTNADSASLRYANADANTGSDHGDARAHALRQRNTYAITDTYRYSDANATPQSHPTAYSTQRDATAAYTITDCHAAADAATAHTITDASSNANADSAYLRRQHCPQLIHQRLRPQLRQHRRHYRHLHPPRRRHPDRYLQLGPRLLGARPPPLRRRQLTLLRLVQLYKRRRQLQQWCPSAANRLRHRR